MPLDNEQTQRAILAEKQKFAQLCKDKANQLADVLGAAADIVGFWNDNDYSTEITDLDLANFRFTKEQLDDYIAMLTQIVIFAQGGQVQPGEYHRVNNRIK